MPEAWMGPLDLLALLVNIAFHVFVLYVFWSLILG